ncbi:MAG: alpha/beta hydrolase [Aquisalinus sp.]|nr:alpha/beta hydrolase [Aquisalinus sp.]
MREEIVQFGEENRLTGILTHSQESKADKPLVIILNAGIVHHVGPNRLHVKMARHLAKVHFDVLRFDLSGLGESMPAAPGKGYEEQSIVDIREALDMMWVRFGERRIILAGICSGADNAYRTALEDVRVSGLILLDPYAYQNTTAQISDLAKRAQDPERWKRLAGRLLSGTDAEDGDEDIMEDDNDRIPPEREIFGQQLQTLTDRRVRMLLLYTSSVRHLINAKNQFHQTFKEFDFSDQLEVDVLAHVDHTYTELSSQNELMTRLDTWLAERT